MRNFMKENLMNNRKESTNEVKEDKYCQEIIVHGSIVYIDEGRSGTVSIGDNQLTLSC